MAVSDSTDFQSTAVELITDARRLLGIQAEEEALEAHELETGMRFLTKMLKAWEADGIGSWTLTEGSLTLISGTAGYIFGTGGDFAVVPFEITDARIYRDTNDMPMTRISRMQYQQLPNKASTGYPTQFFYDRQRDAGTLYVWPTPDTTAGTINFTYRRRIMDIDDGTNDFDLPPEWEEAITSNLARRLIPIYGRGGTPEATQVVMEADAAYQVVKNWDVGGEEGSVFMAPDFSRPGLDW
jgi:hypothetical protein